MKRILGAFAIVAMLVVTGCAAMFDDPAVAERERAEVAKHREARAAEIRAEREAREAREREHAEAVERARAARLAAGVEHAEAEAKRRERERRTFYTHSRINVREQRTTKSAVISQIDAYETVVVDSVQGGWCTVFQQGKRIGYANVSVLHQRQASPDQRRRQNYIKRNPNLAQRTKSLIQQGRIELGMTSSQVRASRGTPSSVNRSVYSFGVHEQWVYRRGSTKSFYLYFEDGVLTSWQD